MQNRACKHKITNEYKKYEKKAGLGYKLCLFRGILPRF